MARPEGNADLDPPSYVITLCLGLEDEGHDPITFRPADNPGSAFADRARAIHHERFCQW